MKRFNRIAISFDRGLFISVLMIICLSSAKAQEGPCSSMNHAAFDFWIGEWRVEAPDGTHVGDSIVKRIQDGCVVHEDWRSTVSNYTGTSYNSYNLETRQWEQYWLDNQGDRLLMTGNVLSKGPNSRQMVLQTKAQANNKGVVSYNQISWTLNEDGSVRQRWETITAGQPTAIVFEGLYQAVKNTESASSP